MRWQIKNFYLLGEYILLEEQMIKKILVITILALMVGQYSGFAATDTILLPKGTQAQKSPQGGIKFSLPNGDSIKIAHLNLATGQVSNCVVYDKNGKVVAKASQGKMIITKKARAVQLPKGIEYVLIDDEVVWAKGANSIPRLDYFLIDDEVVWLPVKLQVPFLKQEMQKLSPQPDPPGNKGKKVTQQ